MKKKITVFLVAILTVCMAATAFVGCGPQAKDEVTVTLNRTSITIDVGAKSRLTATVSDATATVVWSSSDENVATVAEGTVTAVAVGTATITAKVGEVSATCEVTVKAPATLDISDATAALEAGATKQLTATKANTEDAIVWTSSNEAVATVSDSGLVTAVQGGEATITATCGSLEATCVVTVSEKEGNYVLSFMEEAKCGDEGNIGKVGFWNDQNWTGSYVTVTKNVYRDGVNYLSYTSTGFCWHGLQVFYKHEANEAGKAYNLSLKIKSDVAGNIQINGKIVELKVGENTYTDILYREGPSSLAIQMGTPAAGTKEEPIEASMIAAASIEISDITYTEAVLEKLATPTALTIGEGNVVTITDTNGENATSYDLKFYDGDELKSTVSVENGKAFTAPIIAAGTYDIKVVAKGNLPYNPSDESGVLATFTIEGEIDINILNDTFDGESLGEGWVADAQNGTTITPTVANSEVALVVNNSAAAQNYQPQFKHAVELKTGATYTFTVRMKSSVDRNIVLLVQNDGAVSNDWSVFKNVSVAVTSEYQDFTYEFTMERDSSAFFGLMLGKNEETGVQDGDHTVTIDSVSLQIKL